ncbi:MAG: AmmeMemoRadiSam system protein A [Thermodesulfovibrionales bacterium]|nr:AmmeMemoRadiSam system protein A [Thermodesulfovibrionales bacterium]
MHPLVKLAKKAVEAYVKEGRVIESPEGLADEMKMRAGAFVSLKIQGQLRGCIGTIMPVTGCVAEEVIKNAIASSTGDPRFPPVEESEIARLQYSVDVLCPPESVKDISELDAKRYGVIVSLGGRKGLLLPDLEGVDTVEEQLRIARMKAGIGPDEKGIRIERFEVRRYK